MKIISRILLPLLLLGLTASRCQPDQDNIQVIPLRYEDGTTVFPHETELLTATWKEGDTRRFHSGDVAVQEDDPSRIAYGDDEAESLVNSDGMIMETIVKQEDTVYRVRHESAFLRLELQGIFPSGKIAQVDLLRTWGEPVFRSFPEPDGPAQGTLTLWTALTPEDFSNDAFIILVHAPDGSFWSSRIAGIDFQAGTAYRRTARCLPATEAETDLTVTPLSQTLLDRVEPGEYSGITWISEENYAVVSDNLKGGGIVRFTIPLDADGNVGEVTAAPAPGTASDTGKARDCEGIAYAKGNLYVSTEQQQILEYDLEGRATGKTFRIPDDLSLKHIAVNRGFEALTFQESTGLFWTTTEAPLPKDTFLPRVLRLQSFDREGNPLRRYFYQTGEPRKTDAEAAAAQAYVFGVPAMAALDDGRLLVMEREVYVPKGGFLTKLLDSFTQMQLYLVDPAQDPAGILRKSLLCSFSTSAVDLANFEGMCLGPVLPDGNRTVLLIADSQNGAGGLTGEYLKVLLLR